MGGTQSDLRILAGQSGHIMYYAFLQGSSLELETIRARTVLISQPQTLHMK